MAPDGVQYLLPDGVGPTEASRSLGAHLALEGERVRAADRTFYDTFDGRLHEEGLVLLHEAGRIALTDAAAYSERAGAELPDRADRLLLDDLPAGPLREQLLPVVEVRALLPIARVRSRSRTLRVLNDDAKTVARIVVEAPVLAGRRNSRSPLRPRLRLTAVRGYPEELARARDVLEGELGLAAAEQPLHDEAVIAAGGAPGGTQSKPAFMLAPGQRADSVAVVILTALAGVIAANVPGTVADVDSEFLHDLRVAVRRSRSLQRQLKAVFPPEQLEHFRAEFRRLQQATGTARDLDVYLLEFDRFRTALPEAVAPDLEPLRDLLSERRQREHRRMARALRSARTCALLAEWSASLEELVSAPEADRPAAARPIAELAGKRIRRVHRRMVKAGAAIGDESPHADLHDLRKQGKELRYLLEFFTSLYPAEVVKPLVKNLKALQDTLGRFQDREVQAAMLRELREDVAGLDQGAAALMAMGLLVERLEQEQAEARAEFAERFAAFSAKPQRALVKREFG